MASPSASLQPRISTVFGTCGQCRRGATHYVWRGLVTVFCCGTCRRMWPREVRVADPLRGYRIDRELPPNRRRTVHWLHEVRQELDDMIAALTGPPRQPLRPRP